ACPALAPPLARRSLRLDPTRTDTRTGQPIIWSEEGTTMEITHINPEGIYKHPAFTAIVTVTDPRKLHFFAGRTPADENYRCVAPGDMLAQYRQVMELL